MRCTSIFVGVFGVVDPLISGVAVAGAAVDIVVLFDRTRAPKGCLRSGT